ncbi:hypothetical protein SAMN02745246_02006 [Leeuwenhoekiella marinoflava DSM 3653]
MFCGK